MANTESRVKLQGPLIRAKSSQTSPAIASSPATNTIHFALQHDGDQRGALMTHAGLSCPYRATTSNNTYSDRLRLEYRS